MNVGPLDLALALMVSERLSFRNQGMQIAQVSIGFR